MKNIQVTFYSGVGVVTGANFLLESPSTKILIDCGLVQGIKESYEENTKPFEYDVKSIDFLFITHAHLDHIGRVGKIVKDGFNGVIYSTPETKEIAMPMLTDALKVMEMNAKQLGVETPEQKQKQLPLYTMADLDKAFSLWKTIPYHTSTKIGKDFSVYLKDAGHILGSAMYEFSFKNEKGETKKVVFTGDSGNTPTPLLKDTEDITDADYLIVDSVYGDRNHESKDDRDEKFRKIATETIQNGGALVIPAFSVERTQVILYELNNLVEDKKIPSVPIYLDSPLGQKVTDIYAKHIKDFNTGVQKEVRGGDNIFKFPKLVITHGSRDSQEIVKAPNPKIIIAGSGMSTGGRVVWHEMNFLPDPKSTVLLMGYQAIGTLGRRIQERPSTVEIKGGNVPVKARIEMISGYSSHKDSDGLVDLVSKTAEKVKKVFVVMGEPSSSTFLVRRLRDELGVDAIYPERAKIYRLD